MMTDAGRAAALACVGVALVPTPAQAADAAPVSMVESEVVTIRAILRPGATGPQGARFTLDAETLAAMAPVTVKEALRRSPGLAVIDEDAFGLKLNVSVRGLNPRRSGRTLLLEDGAPIQPAPYSDPSAHYYPPLERIAEIEILKGSGQILFGPQSIGGMINFLTEPAAETGAVGFEAAIGERGYSSLHAKLGVGGERGGATLWLTRKAGDGIRDFHDTLVEEVAAKAVVRVGSDHDLQFKATYAEEDTALTEGGLTQERFEISPYYNPFRNDRFVLERTALQVTHDWRLSPDAVLSTQIYYADTFRASYRQADTSIDAMTANAATGCVGAARTDYEGFAARCGNKMRPRRFTFVGVEPQLSARHRIGPFAAATVAGVRLHAEESVRRRYNGLTPDAREGTPGTLLRDDNRIAVNGLALYGQTTLELGPVALMPGLRVERTETRNEARTANFIAVDRALEREETTWLPGLGLSWQVDRRWTLFAGLHRGFAPPRPDRDFNPNAPFNVVRPEASLDSEIGLRAAPVPGVAVSLTGFNLELDDLIVEGPQIGRLSGTFANAGQARHRGLEAWTRLGAREGVFAEAALTYLPVAEFRSAVDESARGVEGNRIPYAPEMLLDATLGWRQGGFTAEIGLNHLSAQFADAANTQAPSADGLRGEIPARTLWRLAGTYAVAETGVQLFASVQNLADDAFIASRADGLFAGAPRQAVVGLRFNR